MVNRNERKIAPLDPPEMERRFQRAWEDAYSPKYAHPADGIRDFIREVLAESIAPH
jgi:hypothetical protein